MKKNILIPILLITAFLACWEVWGLFSPIAKLVCPPPTAVLSRCFHSREILFKESLTTLKEILGGFILAGGLSFVLALIMFSYKTSKTFLQPIFVLLQCVPMFTLAPVIVLWFGWGASAVLIPTILTIFFPLTLTFYHGFISTPNELIEYFRLHKATQTQTFVKLLIPHSIPSIFSGLKVAIGSAGFGAIAGEWVAGNSGLGILILESRRNYEADLTFAGLLTLSIITISLYNLVLHFEKIFFVAYNVQQKAHFREKKKQSKKIAYTIALVACSLAGAITCFSYPTLIRQKNTYELSLLLDWSPNPNHVPIYVGIEKNFFSKRGISLTILKSSDNSSVVPHLMFGKTDLTMYHALGIIRAQLKGLPIVPIGRLIDKSLGGLLCRQDSGIHSIQDLNGKTLGFCLSNNQSLSSLIKTLNSAGIYPGELKNVSADLLSPIITNQIDCVYGGFYNVEGVKLKALGIPIIHFSPDDYGLPTGPQLVICAKENTPASSPQFVKLFQEALHQSILFCKTHPSKAFAIYAKATGKAQKNLADEKLQWEETIKLLANNQSPLSKELQIQLLHTISKHYPELSEPATQYLATLTQHKDEKEHEKA